MARRRSLVICLAVLAGCKSGGANLHPEHLVGNPPAAAPDAPLDLRDGADTPAPSVNPPPRAEVVKPGERRTYTAEDGETVNVYMKPRDITVNRGASTKTETFFRPHFELGLGFSITNQGVGFTVPKLAVELPVSDRWAIVLAGATELSQSRGIGWQAQVIARAEIGRSQKRWKKDAFFAFLIGPAISAVGDSAKLTNVQFVQFGPGLNMGIRVGPVLATCTGGWGAVHFTPPLPGSTTPELSPNGGHLLCEVMGRAF